MKRGRITDGTLLAMNIIEIVQVSCRIYVFRNINTRARGKIRGEKWLRVPWLPEFSGILADLKAFDPLASAGFGDFEGYIASRILLLALEKIKGPPTREAVVDALKVLGQFN